MNFGQILEAIKEGKSASREGWNGKGMYIEKLDLTLPDGVSVDNPCLVLHNVHGKINTWIPSITDLFAEDWTIVNNK